MPSTEEEKDELNKKEIEMDGAAEMIGKKPSFIAAGCLHLVGEDGLINRLRGEGYTVKSMVNY